MSRIILLLSTLLLALSFACACDGPSNKERYELQERCGKRAEAVFERDYPGGGGSGDSATAYTNHYNATLNKCFYLTRTFNQQRNSKGDLVSTSARFTLWDLNDNKELGTYFKIVGNDSSLNCIIVGGTCRSTDDWKAFLKKYMEETENDWQPI